MPVADYNAELFAKTFSNQCFFQRLVRLETNESRGCRENERRIYIDICEKSIWCSRNWANRQKDTLDAYFIEMLSSDDTYKYCLQFMKISLVCFHGNAEVERGFSINSECLVVNLEEDSLSLWLHRVPWYQQ